MLGAEYFEISGIHELFGANLITQKKEKKLKLLKKIFFYVFTCNLSIKPIFYCKLKNISTTFFHFYYLFFIIKKRYCIFLQQKYVMLYALLPRFQRYYSKIFLLP